MKTTKNSQNLLKILEKAQDERRQIMVDASMMCKTNLCENLFDRKYFHEIPIELLRTSEDRCGFFLSIVSYPNMFMIPEVLDELNAFKGIIEEHILYLKANKRKKSSVSEQEILLDRIYDICRKGTRLASERELEINDPCFDIFYRMIKEINKFIDLKIDRGYMMGKRNYRRNTPTDERIVAALYWIANNIQEKSAVLTSDEDFKRLLGVTPRFILNKEFRQYNKSFNKRFKKNLPELYFADRSNKFVDIYTLKELSEYSRDCRISESSLRDLNLNLKLLWDSYSETRFNEYRPRIN